MFFQKIFLLTCFCGITVSLQAQNEERFRPALYIQLPDYCPIPDGMTLHEKTNAIYLTCPNYEPTDADGRKTSPAVLMRITPDGKISKVLDFPEDSIAKDCSPMGIDLGPDGHLYVADNLFTGKPGGPKSRVLRVHLDDQGLPTGVVEVVVRGIHLANGLLWDGEWMYVTDPVITKLENDPAYGKGGLWRFHQSEVTGKAPLVEVNADLAAGDRHLVATMDVQKTKRGDMGGLDGITKAWGAIWVGNVGDGALFRVTFDAEGKAIVTKEYQNPDFRCCDGIFYDRHSDLIFINDPEDNCVRVFDKSRQMSTLWQDPDNDGTGGMLDEPSECIVRDGKLIIANFDRPFPGLTNTKHDKPYTLSVIDLSRTKLTVTFNGKPASPSFGSASGIWQFASEKSQMLLLGHPDAVSAEGIVGPNYRVALDLAAGDSVTLHLPLACKREIRFSWVQKEGDLEILNPKDGTLTIQAKTASRLLMKDFNISLEPQRSPRDLQPVASFPDLTEFLQDVLIEWDWRLQDGIETPREPRTFRQAVEKILSRWNSPEWKQRFQTLSRNSATDEAWEAFWKEVHVAKRAELLAHPAFHVGKLLFVKHVPSVMSHQLTQVYGYCARPGGGIFVLEAPGKTFQTRSLTEKTFPMGNFMKSEISPDGKTIYVPFCECSTAPKMWRDPEKMSQRYQIYAMNSDGSNVRPLTQGEADSFAPVASPTGEIIYLSTLRGTFHRCGAGPCYLYTLTLMDAQGGNIRPISFHETNEWDPTVLDNGRILYTRWDYVDRNAIHYQNLWQTRLDGTDVRIFYGNNTFVPCGIWEARQVPGSNKIMGIGGPHHGMSAGSVILVDPTQGVDGSRPITRLTPDVAFPETEETLAYGTGYMDFDTPSRGGWFTNLPGERLPLSESQRRWPGQTFKSPFPLSEDYFIASFSYDRIIGEMGANPPNQYGLYFADRWGNRELIYRDTNISSLWAMPLVPLKRRIYDGFTPYVVSDAIPPVVDKWEIPQNVFGTMLMQNVYDADPKLPEGTKITALRIVQVLPKSTPNANSPMVGYANASPGKQILGTVPVESDGSAYFELPACTPVLFQALDEQGRAVQTMRSLTYVQPGENANCIGCHEDRMKTPETTARQTLAASRPISKIEPGPDGSKPFSYPRLVQPVLDKYCVQCHNADKPNGVILTGEIEGHYTKSYNQLEKYVSYSAWGRPNNNHEPLTQPGQFGTLGSPLAQYLEPTHYDVRMTPAEKERLYLWMDGGNSLFYGTFHFNDQKRQQQGEIITGPDAE
ncbi:MAG: hypothetical protein Q4D62_09960 [Planctomycetia bacterium]|nr:hypothetical protein [Planctomycetia bacterium]